MLSGIQGVWSRSGWIRKESAEKLGTILKIGCLARCIREYCFDITIVSPLTMSSAVYGPVDSL